MAKKCPFPNFDWSHMPLGWNEFAGGEANLNATKPLITDEYGVFKAEYYGSLTCWPVPMALQILGIMNCDIGLGTPEQVMERILESARLAYTGREGWLMISLFPEKDENGVALVNACLFCNWADYAGFSTYRTIREAHLGIDENRNLLTEERNKMLKVHYSCQKKLRKKALQEQEAPEPVVKASTPPPKTKEEGREGENEPETTAESLNQKKNLGGSPGVDPDGKIAAKINELKLAGVKEDDIPWEIRFTKFVQKLKKNKIETKYLNVKVPPRITRKEYTLRVGISLDTVKKIIKKSSN